MNDADNLGRRLRLIRKERKLTQVEVAEAVGISRSHLAQIEGGKDPGFRTFRDLAQYFGVSLDYLNGTAATPPLPQLTNLSKDPDEIILIDFWRTLNETERALLLAFIRRSTSVTTS